jgi:hypothetical protein
MDLAVLNFAATHRARKRKEQKFLNYWFLALETR